MESTPLSRVWQYGTVSAEPTPKEHKHSELWTVTFDASAIFQTPKAMTMSWVDRREVA